MLKKSNALTPATPKANCVLTGDSDEPEGAGSVYSGSESSLETVPAKFTSASAQISTRRAPCRAALKDSSAHATVNAQIPC